MTTVLPVGDEGRSIVCLLYIMVLHKTILDIVPPWHLRDNST